MTAAQQTRLAPLAPPYPDDVAGTLSRMMPPGIEPLRLFRTVAHNKHILERFRTTGAYILNLGMVDPHDREVLVHRTCARCGCEYEWGVHAAVFAPAVGLTAQQLAATVEGGGGSRLVAARVAPGAPGGRAARHGDGLRRAVAGPLVHLVTGAARGADRHGRLLPPRLVRRQRDRRRARGGGSPLSRRARFPIALAA
jgi:hypothetical protein